MSSVHLLVLIHGMWGNPNHLQELKRIVQEKHETAVDGTELSVLIAETNREEGTYDGIDWGAERVVEEIFAEVEKIEGANKRVTRFSVTGYSLGGLLSRYVIGILHQREFFKNVSPINFNTFATPHIGLLRYPTLFSSLKFSLGPKLLSRTGEQFYCSDKWSASGRPLLEVMADAQRIFYQALELFPHTTIYANAINDETVPYVAAAIELEDPFVDFDTNGIEIELHEEYSPLIRSFSLPPFPPPSTPKPYIFSPAWFGSITPSRPFLPPALDFKFPLNIIIYILLPILIPTALSLAIIRLYFDSRSSRARIRLLEESSGSQRLIHAVAALEKRVEDTVVDLLDDPDDPDDMSDIASHSRTIADGKAVNKKHGNSSNRTQQPILTPLQQRLVANLNSLPNLKKERAFIHPARNSHAVIVCRDVKRFNIHRRGEGVVRHWADNFVL